MTVREICGHLEEFYGINVSPDPISTVTDAVLEAVTGWQGRPLDTCYPPVFFDAIRVKVRDEGFVRNKAVHIALGIRPPQPFQRCFASPDPSWAAAPDGTKEVPGIWIEQTEDANIKVDFYEICRLEVSTKPRPQSTRHISDFCLPSPLSRRSYNFYISLSLMT